MDAGLCRELGQNPGKQGLQICGRSHAKRLLRLHEAGKEDDSEEEK
jgi:hypothetical protein